MGRGYLEAKFRRLHEGFAAQRATWLADLLNEHLLGSLPTDVQAAAAIPDSDPFISVTRLVGEIRSSLAMAPQADAMTPSALEPAPTE